MATSTFAFFDAFKEKVAEKVHNLGSDTLKVFLTNTAPNAATHTAYDGASGITGPAEIATGNGYTVGGNAATVSSSSQTAGTYKLVLTSPAQWVSGPSAMAAFRYPVLYNSTAAGQDLIGWWDNGSTITPAIGDTFDLTLDGTNGVLTLT